MSSSEFRPTIRDIARKAGCHYSTVSLALRNHPRIPLRTQERIREIAGQLGYRTDAMLAALCAYRDWNDQDFLSWVDRFRPDVIVTKLAEVLTSLKRASYRVPEDIGVAYHSLDEGRLGLSGMKKNSFQIGVMAVDLLVDMLHRNERGIPARAYLLMVEGTWYEGCTVRPIASAPVPALAV